MFAEGKLVLYRSDVSPWRTLWHNDGVYAFTAQMQKTGEFDLFGLSSIGGRWPVSKGGLVDTHRRTSWCLPGGP